MNEIKVEQVIDDIFLSVIKILENDLVKSHDKLREGLFHGIVLHKTGVLESMINVPKKTYERIIDNGKKSIVISYVSSFDKADMIDIKRRDITSQISDVGERYLLCKLLPNTYEMNEKMKLTELECFMRRVHLIDDLKPKIGYGNRIIKSNNLKVPEIDDRFGIIYTENMKNKIEPKGQTTVFAWLNIEGEKKDWKLPSKEFKQALDDTIAYSVVDLAMR